MPRPKFRKCPNCGGNLRNLYESTYKGFRKVGERCPDCRYVSFDEDDREKLRSNLEGRWSSVG